MSCGKGAHYGYNCPPRVLVISNPEPCKNQTINELPQTLPSFHPTCYYRDESPFTCNSNPNIVDDFPNVFNPPPQTPKYSYEFCRNDAYYGHNCPPQVSFTYDPKPKRRRKKKSKLQKSKRLKLDIKRFLFAMMMTRTIPLQSYPRNPITLSMRDEYLDTILATKSDEFIKSSVENLVPNPSESEGEHECDVSACDDFTTFSKLLFDDANDDFSSSNNDSFYDEDIPKEIYSNPLFDEEIISMKIDPHHFNVESDLIESLLNHDSLIISSSSSNIDSLLDEFAGELTFLKSIPPEINETDCDPEEEIHLIKKLFNSFLEEIDLSFTPDDPMPSGIEEDDYESEKDILILEELLSNDSLSLPENKSFHFDIPSSSRPPAKPPDGNSKILNVKVMGDIEHNIPMPKLMLTQPTLVLNQEKSPNLLSHQGHKASQPSTKCPMMIYGRNTPILDVPFLYFYPP
uniref:Reverse transcriptase domain-containing protein n=1 Tax=Tanacetum cinerariifolium TaxID=118510 RepID=A0A6L2M0P9_TANCI|nr:hypothetical protein [Tanacetum cinerariifolium]